MSLKYYDPLYGQQRYKRRYVWGIQGYVLGMISAVALFYLITGGIP